MQEQLPTDVFKERTWTYSQRVLGGLPYSLRIVQTAMDVASIGSHSQLRDAIYP
jgi:hypothetical protein